MKRIKTSLIIILLFFVWVLFHIQVMAEQGPATGKTTSPVLKKSVMCESLQDGLPVNQTIVFDVSKGTAYCWSNFDPVAEEGVVYHKWYRKGELISTNKLAVHPPRWAVYSILRLRQADVGPWRLDITNENGDILKTHRFSITE